VKSFTYVEAFKTRYVLAFKQAQTNQAGWLFKAHGLFLNHLYALAISIRVSLLECLATSVHDEVATHKMYQP